MITKWKSGDKISIKKRFNEMQRLIKPFIKKYKKPVLVHATSNETNFRKIINEGKIKVPYKKETNHSYIETILGIYPCIFLSLGFAYSCSYNFKYSFIFDLDYVKKCDYYKNSVSYQCYKSVAQYLAEKNPEDLEKLAKKSKVCKKVVDKFYNVSYLGKKRVLFDFWKCEKEIFDMINRSSKKKELIEIIRNVADDKYVRYPKSERKSMEKYKEDSVPEVIVKKDINLKKDDLFLGFYIKGKIPRAIRNKLIEDYSDKIIFDGKKIIKVKELR